MRRRLCFLLVIAALLITGLLTTTAQDGGTYTVRLGDVLDLIAAAYDVDTTCLAAANDLANPNKLRAGQVLTIDLSCPRYTGPAFVTNPRDGGETTTTSVRDSGQGGGGVVAGPNDQTYMVKRNDTLDTIAQAFNVSIISLRLVNALENPNKLMAGDTLIIPGDAPPYGAYPALSNPIVAAGATGDLELGQGGGGAALGPGDEAYVVQPRDVLDRIGARYDRQVDCIVQGNNLADPHRLYAGQMIIIPGNCPPYDGLDFVPSRAGG